MHSAVSDGDSPGWSRDAKVESFSEWRQQVVHWGHRAWHARLCAAVVHWLPDPECGGSVPLQVALASVFRLTSHVLHVLVFSVCLLF